MFVKSSIARCFSNAIVKVSRNNFEHSCDRNDTFEKKKTITATEIVLVQLFSYSVVSKLKMKITENTMAPSYHSKVTSTQNKGVLLFSCLGDGV